MPPCIQQIKLRLPVVNSTSERTCFMLQGLPPSFLIPKGGDDVLTFRHAARDIVLAVRSHYKMLQLQVPAIINKATKHSCVSPKGEAKAREAISSWWRLRERRRTGMR